MSGQERVGDLSPYLLKKLFDESKPERSGQLFEVWKSSRRRAQTDLFWLARLLRYAITEKAHRDATENVFIKKNPDTTLDDLSVEVPDRLLFVSRDSYKSSLANADFVQWIVAYPDVKLAVQSSKFERAAPFTQEVKSFFIVPEMPDGSMALNTRFQVLFPDHLLPERSRGADGEFTTPARTKFWKEPTCSSIGIEESRASVHFHLLRSDDACSEANSGQESSAEARANIGRKLIESRNLGDIRLFVGTPQWEGDAYEMLRESLGEDLLVMVKAAWRVKDESAKKAEAELIEADYDLLFSHDANGKPKLTYKVLKSFQRASASRFATQQLCVSAIAKPKIEITTATIEAHLLPSASETAVLASTPMISVWDLAYIANTRADYSVGCAGLRAETRGAIVRDVQRGQWQKAELIQAMVAQAVQFRIHTIWIEGTNGAPWIQDDLTAALRLAGAKTTRVDFIPVENLLDAKAKRFEDIFSALRKDELWFGVDPSQVSVLYELTQTRGKKHDDVADSLGRLIRKLHEPIETTPAEQPASPALMMLQEKRLRDLVYGVSDKEWKGSEPEPAWGYRVEELKSEELKEFEGQPVFRDSHEYLYGGQK